MSRRAVVLRSLVVLLSATVAAADPATQSSLPWLVQGTGPVARAGRILFFGEAYGIAPRANVAQGIAVFPESDASGEAIDGAGGSDVYSAIADGASGWFVSGPFTTFGALSRRGLVHVLANGHADPAFTADLNVGGSSSFGAFGMVLNGGQLIVAGSFTTVNLVPRNGLAWLNAATGQVLAVAPAVTGRAVALSGNTLFVGDASVYALNATTGAAIAAYAPPVLSPGGSVETLAVEGSSVFAGGSFSTVNGAARMGLAKLDMATGFLDPVWSPSPLYAGSPGNIRGLAASSGTLYIGGFFNSMSGLPRNNLAAVSTSTGAVSSWRADTSRTVNGLAVASGALYVGGIFDSIGGVPRLLVAAISQSTPATVLPWNPSLTGLIRGVATGAGKVAPFGSLNNWGIRERQGLAAVDVVTGALLPWAPAFGGGPIKLLADGSRLIVGGDFSSIDGAGRSNLAAFDLETRALLPLAPTVNGRVFALAVANGVLYIGGNFNLVNGMTRLNLAAIDLQTGAVLPWDPQADNIVFDIVARSGSVIVAGSFTSLIGATGSGTGFRTRIGVGELTFAGAVTNLDASVVGGNVNALATSGTTLFLGGTFSMVGGVGRANAAAVNVGTGALLPWNPVVNGQVAQFSIARGFVYLRGSFSSVGGGARTRLARVNVSDAALSPWQLPGTPQSVNAIEAAEDGLLLNVSYSSATALYRQNGWFLPESSYAGIPGPAAEPSARVFGSTLVVNFEPPVLGPRPTSYLLEAGSAPNLANLGTLPLATNAFSVGGVPPGIYYLRTRAVGPGGVGAASRELVVAVGGATCTAPPGEPAAPGTTVSGGSIVVDWRAAPGSAPSTYTLVAGSASGLANLATLPLGSGTSFATAGVPPGAFFVRVIASNACGQSAASADSVLRVGGALGPPGTPVQVTGTAAGGVITVSWVSSTGGAPTSHVLEAGTGPTLANLGTVGLGAATGFTVGGVPAGTYYLRIRALNAVGSSPPSAELILVMP